MMHIWLLPLQESGFRMLEYHGQDVTTTFRVDGRFLGKYQGTKTGYLVLRDDGTGSYMYDYHMKTSGNSCPEAPIQILWGFLVDEKGAIVRFERPYGYSYPIIYVSTGTPSFQSCTREAMLDYVLEYRDGSLGVSSSDDWRKAP